MKLDLDTGRISDRAVELCFKNLGFYVFKNLKTSKAKLTWVNLLIGFRVKGQGHSKQMHKLSTAAVLFVGDKGCKKPRF